MGFAVERHPVSAEFLRAYGMRSVTNLIVRQSWQRRPDHRTQRARRCRSARRRLSNRPMKEDRERPHVRPRRCRIEVRYRHVHDALAALRAQAAELARLNVTVELHFTYDEEFGGLAGPGFLLDNGLTKPDYAIAASFSYAVVTAHNGCLQLEVTVHGKSGHGATPETGRDAFRAGVAILNAIYAEADALKAKKSRVRGIDHPTMIVGLIDGGINTNVVPDRLTFRMDRRMTPEENPADVEARVRGLIEAAAAPHDGIRVEIRRLLLANALSPRPGHEKLVAAIQRHGKAVFGEDLPAVGVPLYADARLYGEHGVPIVMYGAGPRTIAESNAKRPDENLLLEDLRRATKVIAATVHDLLSA
jgi:acetylornithine deacetylase/succinyl-diaminopimelate desuccinylase-like protein